MSQEQTICVPDIGGVKEVEVIEILVHPGDELKVDTPMLTLESDKASMEIPAPVAGKVIAILVKIGDKVSQGSSILTVVASAGVGVVDKKPVSEEGSAAPAVSPAPPALLPEGARGEQKVPASSPQEGRGEQKVPTATSKHADASAYAGPAVRRLAKEFGVSLSACNKVTSNPIFFAETFIIFVFNKTVTPFFFKRLCNTCTKSTSAAGMS
jgi:pyruvate dehydrogenase E2 component (dihydrolipoamide acetyltransferase)